MIFQRSVMPHSINPRPVFDDPLFFELAEQFIKMPLMNPWLWVCCVLDNSMYSLSVTFSGMEEGAGFSQRHFHQDAVISNALIPNCRRFSNVASFSSGQGFSLNNPQELGSSSHRPRGRSSTSSSASPMSIVLMTMGWGPNRRSRKCSTLQVVLEEFMLIMCFRNMRIRHSRSWRNPRSSLPMYSMYSSCSSSPRKILRHFRWLPHPIFPSAATLSNSCYWPKHAGRLVTNLVLGWSPPASEVASSPADAVDGDAM